MSRWLKHFSFRFQPHTLRLTFVFLAIIMCMSLAFSAVLYNVTTVQLDKQLPSDGYTDLDGVFGTTDRIARYLGDHIKSGKAEILKKLIAINLAMFVVGTIISYLLARRMLRPIENVMQAQARFVSDASHELRTPLTAIQTTNEVMLRKKNLKLPEAKEVIKQNIDDVVRLQRMTTMLLELANRETATLMIKPINIHDVISRALTNVAPHAGNKKISIDDQTRPEWIQADVELAAQALTTILDNAIKYSPDHSTIILATSAIRHSTVRLSIIDHGSGIAETDIPRVFDRFFRSDNARSRQQHDGYGLGLAIAKNIMELHNGTIHAASKLGKGSTFMLDFPSGKKSNS